MSDSRNSATAAMDARTIAKILQDEETLRLQGEASKYRLQLEAQTCLKAYFQPARYASHPSEELRGIADYFVPTPVVGGDNNATFTAEKKLLESAKTSFDYKSGTNAATTILIHKRPQTPEDFYELAMSLAADGRYYYGENYEVAECVTQHTSQDNKAERIAELEAQCHAEVAEAETRYVETLVSLGELAKADLDVVEQRYQVSMRFATPRTAVVFAANRTNELNRVQDSLFRQTEFARQVYEQEVAEIKADYAEKIVAVSAVSVSATGVALTTVNLYAETKDEATSAPQDALGAVQNFRHNLLCDAERAGLRFVFIYKQFSNEEVSLLTRHCPVTPDDFYALAMTIKAGRQRFGGEYFDVYYDGETASPAVLKSFMYNLFSDAAKAGHLLAKSELIEATIQGEREARKHVTLKKFHGIHGMSIHLPRKFSTADDLHKLGSDLLRQYRIMARTSSCLAGEPMVGPYYELADSRYAKALADSLLNYAKDRRQAEAQERVRRAYADQAARVSDNNNALFAQRVGGEAQQPNRPYAGVTTRVTMQTISEGLLPGTITSPDPSIVTTDKSSLSNDSSGTPAFLPKSASIVASPGGLKVLESDEASQTYSPVSALVSGR